MQNAHELFLYELTDALDAEHRISEALSQQVEESSNAALQSAFQAHRKQTENQIERLEQCFDLLGEDAEETACAGIKGLIEEHESMIGEDPSPDILDVFNVAAAIKVERYEISSYESLIRLAEMLKQTKITRLLKQNLKEEEQTLKKMTAFAIKVKPENLNAVDQQQEGSRAEGFGEEFGEGKEVQGQTGPQIVKKSGSRRKKAA
jgi:ferritin-like metal-binding protein YciE